MSSEMSCCGGLALDGLQVPIKSDPALPSSAGQGRENVMEGLCIEMRAGGITHQLLSLAKQISLRKKYKFLANQIRVGL